MVSWYPEGGFHRVLQALVEVRERFGVTYRTSSHVKYVDLCYGKVSSVTLELVERLAANVAIINVDLVYAYNCLLLSSPKETYLSSKSTSYSSIFFYWAMDRVIPELRAPNIFLEDKHQESFDNIFMRQSTPEEPSFYVHVPSRTDPTAAPEGKDSIVILVPVGHLMNKAEGQGLEAHRQQG